MRNSNLSQYESQPASGKARVIEFTQRNYSRAADFVSHSAGKVKDEFTPREDAVLWKGVLAGAVAGLAATAVMTAFQLGWSKGKEELQHLRTRNKDEEKQSSGQGSEESESSTVKVAESVSNRVRGRGLQQSEKEPASYIVHFTFGTLMGAIYGISTEYLPIANLGHGLLHGIALWGGADALGLPAFGFSSPVTERSAGELTYEILAHAVYGVSSESARRLVRGWMD
jgi:putative membrane protein